MVFISDGVGLEKPSERRRVDARLVMVKSQLGNLGLPGILEPPDIGDRRVAIGVLSNQSQRVSI